MAARIKGFFDGVRAEYAKIIFPSPETLKRETIAALVISVLIGVTIFVLDSVLKSLLTLIL